MNKILGFSWAGMFVLCAWLGTVQTNNLFVKIILSLIAVLFFVPGALLLYNGITEKKKSLVKTVRYLSLASLVLTTFFLVFTIAMVSSSASAFTISYFVLILISSPLFCGKYVWWAVLFLWACLLFASFYKKDTSKKKKPAKK